MQFKWRIITAFTLVIFSCFSWQLTKFETVSVMAGVGDKVIMLDSGHGGWEPCVKS